MSSPRFVKNQGYVLVVNIFFCSSHIKISTFAMKFNSSTAQS